MECLTCPSVLTKFNTKDWAGEGGHCDTCNEDQTQQGCVFCGTYCHCDTIYEQHRDNQLD